MHNYNINKSLIAINRIIPHNINKQSRPELTASEELIRFASINLICVIIIFLLMSLCYLTHVFYTGAWKPLMT